MVRRGDAVWISGGIKATGTRTVNRLSIKVGETLALMVYQGNPIAREMLRQIRRQPATA